MSASFPIGRVVARPKAIVQARRAHQVSAACCLLNRWRTRALISCKFWTNRAVEGATVGGNY